MKIGEARKIYSAQLKEFQEQKLSLAKQKKELERKMGIFLTERKNMPMRRQL